MKDVSVYRTAIGSAVAKGATSNCRGHRSNMTMTMTKNAAVTSAGPMPDVLLAVNTIIAASPINVHALTGEEAIRSIAENLFLEGEMIGLSRRPTDDAGEMSESKNCQRSELIEKPDTCQAFDRILVSPLSKNDGITVFRHALVRLDQMTDAVGLLKASINVSALIQERQHVWAWIAVNSTSVKEYREAIDALNTILAVYKVHTAPESNKSPLPLGDNRLLYLNPLPITRSIAAVKKAQNAIKAEAKAERIEAMQAVNLPILANLHGDKPMIQLAGEDRLLSDFASELADHVTEHLYIRNGEVVVLEGMELTAIKPDRFRTWVEDHVICYRQVGAGRKMYQIGLTMGKETAAGVLCSPQFLSKLRKIQQVNDCRLPVMRKDGKIELLPNGYDPEAQVLTIEEVKYDTEMDLANATSIIDDIFSEFVFADERRSKSVVIAGMVGLYGKHLLPALSLRPCFIMTANAEGAGKGLIASVMITPALGSRPVGRKAETDDEMAKVIATSVKESRPLLFLDNVRGHLVSSSLEAFLTAPKYEDRKLGGNEFISGDNVTQVVITGNGLTVSPDIRRRSLFVELLLEVERAEDRQIKRPLEAATLTALRPQLLAALWAMVKAWDGAGRPIPTKINAQLLSWSKIIAGIVEAAGYGCPLETATVAIAADQDGKDMRTLVAAMAARDEMAFRDVVDLAKKLEVFTNILGEGADLDRKARRIFSDILKKYNGRLVLHWKFRIEGEGHSRRYSVEDVVGPPPVIDMSQLEEKGAGLHDVHDQHDVSASITQPPPPISQPKYHADHAIMQTSISTTTSNGNEGAILAQNQPLDTTTATETTTATATEEDPYSFNQMRKEIAQYVQ